ncbi:hypothetical protein [Streptomyces antimicrobicus]|uniref:Uncharacterized protein n=1 Tax=Streptomyces antimicrobicus TaxID=2883108 RepID=A0ABS8B4K0_9ACTN|nr:hypothetical protein [Streptomyces antimicrobicus]MCB5179531.1 hypothetical protein [Streptomyces antimicrobicus]
MSPYRKAAAQAADLITAAEMLHTYYAALKAAGFTEAQALTLVRDTQGRAFGKHE